MMVWKPGLWGAYGRAISVVTCVPCTVATCSQGRTALRLACEAGQLICAELLVSRGAGLRVAADDGSSEWAWRDHFRGLAMRLVTAEPTP